MGVYDIDMSTDHEVWDATETIVYESKTEEAPPGIVAVVEGTLWLAIRKDLIAGDAALANSDLRVDLPGTNMSGIVPKVHDIMQREDGTRWVINVVEIVAIENEYRVGVIRSRKPAGG